MYQCPRCKSDKVHFSRTRSKWEAWRKKITGKRPYRCRDCGWRGWAPDSGARFSSDEIEYSSRAIAPEPPNLKGTELARTDRASRDLDLDQRDTLTPVDSKPE